MKAVRSGLRRRGLRVVVALLLLLLATLCASFCAAQSDPRALRPAIAARYPSVRWVTTARLAAWMEAGGVHLLDAREAAEHAVSHLRGARRVDPERPDLRALPFGRGERVVVYCSVGYRSGAVAARMTEAGFTDVSNLEGGIFAWANEGRPLFRGDRPVTRVHPYDAMWGRMLRPALRSPLP